MTNNNTIYYTYTNTKTNTNNNTNTKTKTNTKSNPKCVPAADRVVLAARLVPAWQPSTSQSVSIPGSEHTVTRALVGQQNTTHRNVITPDNIRQYNYTLPLSLSLSPVLELNIMVVVLSYDIDQIRSVTRSEMEIIRVSTKILVSTV